MIRGGGYVCVVDDKGETLTNLVSSLKNRLTERYGEPLKPVNESETAITIGDIKDFTEYTSTSLRECWSVDCVIVDSAPDSLFPSWREVQESQGGIHGIVYLEINFMPGMDEVFVSLYYRIDLKQFVK